MMGHERNRYRNPLILRAVIAIVLVVLVAACGGRKGRRPATTQPTPIDDSSTRNPDPLPPPPPAPAPRERGSDADSLSEFERADDITSMTLEEINSQSPLEDVLFRYDSAELDAEARRLIDQHASWMNRYPTVTVLIEGHCDERGTAEYNLALGERRAMAIYNYLASRGISGERLRTISYGKEFPLDPGHDETAWTRNRRGHFEITSK